MDTLHASVILPTAKPKTLKGILTKQKNGSLRNLMKPYLIYELAEKSITLKGAYLLDHTEGKFEPVALSFSDEKSYLITEESIDEFDKKLAAKIEGQQANKRLQQALQHEQTCKNIALAAAYKAPEKYSLIMSTMSCN